MKIHTILTLLVLSTASFAITGCETLSGAGRDLQKAGQAVENAAD